MLYPICDLGLHHLATPIVPLCWPSPPPQFFADAGRAGGRNYPLAQKDDAERALPPSSTSARNRSSTRPSVPARIRADPGERYQLRITTTAVEPEASDELKSIYPGPRCLQDRCFPHGDRAFVARWCVGSKVETAGGVFQVREDEPAPRIGVGLHRTP